MFSSLSPSGVSTSAKTHFCDAPQWQVHLFCQLEEKGENSWMAKWKRKCSPTFPSLHPSLVPSPPLWLSFYFWPWLNWLAPRQGLQSDFGHGCQRVQARATHFPPHRLSCASVGGGTTVWRALLLLSITRVPWEKECGVMVLMLSDVVKSRVTVLLPG